MERSKRLMRDAAKADRRQRQLGIAQRAKRDAEEAAGRVVAPRDEMAAAEMAEVFCHTCCTACVRVSPSFCSWM